MGWYKEVPTLEKHLIDIASVTTVAATVTNHLPSAAAILTLVWTIIRIYETETVRSLLGKKKVETKDE